VKERLLGFLFCGVLVAVAVNLTADKIHTWRFRGLALVPDPLVHPPF